MATKRVSSPVATPRAAATPPPSSRPSLPRCTFCGQRWRRPSERLAARHEAALGGGGAFNAVHIRGGDKASELTAPQHKRLFRAAKHDEWWIGRIARAFGGDEHATGIGLATDRQHKGAKRARLEESSAGWWHACGLKDGES